MRHENTEDKMQKTGLKKFYQVCFVLLIGLGFFAVGWLGGSGRIAFIKSGLSSQNDQLPADLDYASVEQLYDALRESYDGKLDQQTLLDGLKDGLASAADDAYTEYMNVEDAEEFNAQLNGSFDGIGAELDKKDGEISIVAPIKGFPAEREGLQSGDIIAAIDGQPTTGMSVTEAVKKIRGEAGTNIKLTIIRDGKPIEFEITRERITIPSVEHDMLKGNIGYIRISRFSDDTTKLAREAAEDLKKQGAESVILDLRGNPGGLLNASVEVSSLWLNEGTTVLEERRGGQTIKTYKATGDPVLSGVPTVVLVDGGSASASEIVAGALSDNKAATLMGEKTFGKGSVQDIVPLTSGGILKVTIARWYTPSGHNIDKEGISPAEKVEFDQKAAKKDIDNQKDAALKYLNQ